MISSQDEMSCKSDQNQAEASVDTSVEASGEVASKEGDTAESTNRAENGKVENSNKRKIEDVTGPPQDEKESKPEEETNEKSVQKKIRLDDDAGTTAVTATAASTVA